MRFIVHCLDKPDSQDLRMATRSAHLEYIDASGIEVVMAGPLLSDDGTTMLGSLFVLEAESLEDVRRFAEQDPYRKAGLFQTVNIHPFRKVFPR